MNYFYDWYQLWNCIQIIGYVNYGLEIFAIVDVFINFVFWGSECYDNQHIAKNIGTDKAIPNAQTANWPRPNTQLVWKKEILFYCL